MSTPIFYNKFQVRKDINNLERLKIVNQVLFNKRYGLVTELSDKYNVSRQFIYDLKSRVLSFCQSDCLSEPAPSLKEDSLQAIFTLRLAGACSISGIQSCMSSFYSSYYCSTGFISQSLFQAGKQLPGVVEASEVLVCVVYASDEIYGKSQPILIIVEPLSMVILSIELAQNCQGDTWAVHWQSIQTQGYLPEYIVKDEGKGLQAGVELLGEPVEVQSDTFHALSYKLGKLDKQLLSAAYQAIEKEYRALKRLEATPNHLDRQQEYSQAFQETPKAIEQYQNFHTHYSKLLDCLQVFDKQGFLKDLKQVKQQFDQALNELSQLPVSGLKKEIQAIENLKSRLFYFYQVAAQVNQQLYRKYDPVVLPYLVQAWQLHKTQLKIKHKPQYKAKCKAKESAILKQVQQYLKAGFLEIKEQVYEQLDSIVQSSSAVECINSWLRNHLNTTKNQITQEHLNLLMFYHNHRRFQSGKRKGKTPMEILTKQKQEQDWLDLLLQKIKV